MSANTTPKKLSHTVPHIVTKEYGNIDFESSCEE